MAVYVYESACGAALHRRASNTCACARKHGVLIPASVVLRRSLETSQWEMQGTHLVLAVLLSVVILQLQSASGSLEFTWRNERAIAHPPLSANALLEEANHFVKVLSYTILC